jgi:hypothetical protein
MKKMDDESALFWRLPNKICKVCRHPAKDICDNLRDEGFVYRECA